MLSDLILIAADTAHGATELAEGASKLTVIFDTFGINGKILVSQAINFLVVTFVLWRFAFKPVMVTLDERQEKIAEGLQFAEESRVQLAETEKRQAEVLREANIMAQEILHEARDKALGFEEKMKNETALQIEEMRRRAEEANELERKKMMTEVRQEIARLVVMTSGKVLQRELADDEKQRLDRAAAQEISQLN